VNKELAGEIRDSFSKEGAMNDIKRASMKPGTVQGECCNLIEKKSGGYLCAQRGTAYCMLPILDEHWLEAESCGRYGVPLSKAI